MKMKMKKKKMKMKMKKLKKEKLREGRKKAERGKTRTRTRGKARRKRIGVGTTKRGRRVRGPLRTGLAPCSAALFPSSSLLPATARSLALLLLSSVSVLL